MRSVIDQRISTFHDAVVAMQTGRFDVSVPAGTEDDLAQLGSAINELAQVLGNRFQEVEKLARVTERANAGLTLDEVLNFLYEAFRTLIPYDRIGVALLEKEGTVVRARWSRTESRVVCLEDGYSAPLEGSSLEEIIRTGKPRIINDLDSYLRANPGSESTRRIVQEGMRSSLTCPLIAPRKPIGFIFFSSQSVNTYENAHQELFLRIAGQLSVILEKSRLYERILELNQQLLSVQTELEHQANHDALTRVWNRGAILRILEKELYLSRRESKPLSVVMTDIDHFKQLNDTHGHQAGDAVLQEIANRLWSSLRSAEAVGRYGGEEFIIVLYPCDQDAVVQLMERLRRSVSSKGIKANGGLIQATISLGAAVGHDTTQIDLETFVRVADKALYRSKNAGRNRSEYDVIV